MVSRARLAAWTTLAVAVLALVGVCDAQTNAGEFTTVTETQTSFDPTKFGTQPLKRSGQAMARVDNDKMVMFGGLTSAGTVNDLWEYSMATGNWTRLHDGIDLSSNSSAPQTPHARVGHSVVIMGSEVWVFGGYSVLFGDLNDLWAFDRPTGAWRNVVAPEPRPAQRNGQSALVSDTSSKKFVVFGGNLRNDMWQYDVVSNKWTMLMDDFDEGGALRHTTPVLLALAAAVVTTFML